MKVNPNVVRLDDQIAPPAFHFKVDLGVDYGQGVGSDFNENVALLKGFSEAVERHVFHARLSHLHGATSSGFAAHSNRNDAIKKSRLELLERDSFLTMWLSGKHPKWISNPQLDMESSRSYKGLADHGFEIHFGLISRVDGYGVYIGVLNCTKHAAGYVVSTTCSTNQDSALPSLVLDLRRSANFVLNKHIAQSFQFSYDGDVSSAQETLEYYLNPKNCNPILELLDGQDECMVLESPKIDSSILDHGLDGLPWPIFVAQSSSTECQKFFFGKPIDQVINWERLKKTGAGILRTVPQPLP